MALFTMSFIPISTTPFAPEALNATCYPPDLVALRIFAASFPSADFSDWEASDDCCAWGRSVNCNSTSTQKVSSGSIVVGRRVTGLSLDAQERLSSAGRSFNPNTFPLCALSALSSLKLWGGWLSGRIPHCIGTNLTNLVELQLSSNALTGPIPPSFSRLQSLQSLYLYEKSLSGPLPSFLSDGRLPNLTVLSLSLNSFSGSLPAVFHAPNLFYLSLDSNSFSGSLPAFNNCPHLALLGLSRNSFSGSISRTLFAPALSSLDLSFNALSGTMPEPSLLPSLVSLHLSNNLLNGSIPESFCQLTELQELDLSSNAFSGQLFGATALCGEPKFLNLSSLSLSHNQRAGPFPFCLGYLLKLQHLDLSYNSFKGSIPSSWQNLSSLMSLELSGNTLVSANLSAPSSPPWLFQLPALRSIALSSTGLQAEDLGCLPLLNTSLQFDGDLDISHNNLSADVLRCFPQRFILLSTLNMSGNPLALNLNNPKEVNLLPQITYLLDLSSCELTGSLTDLFFDRLAPSGISELHLARNQIVGRIPAQLGNFSSPWFLDLAHNFFTSFARAGGGIPLDALQYINLSNNMFAGSLASLLVDLINKTNSEEVICVNELIDLDLSHNSLTGHIPPSVGHCIDKRIKLNDNNLEGFIPRYLFQNITDNGLEILSLSNNQLRGEIPSSMKKLKHLKLLDLSHNKLQGNLEATLFANASDQFRELRVLVLGYNRFTGSIPALLGRFMPALQVIDMSNNQISGLIPESLRDLPTFKIVERSRSSLATRGTLFEEIRINVKGSSLDYEYVLQLLTSIDLSGNNLSGPIPTGLGALSGLVSLNFSRNKLSGEIPSDLGMLVEQLQSLDLSFNQLVGPIPTSFLNLTKLEVFDVSYNKGLRGSIPSSPQFEREESYIGDPDLCGEHILHPCAIDSNSSGTQPGIAGDNSSKQQSSFARWIDEWIAIPGLWLGILVGFVGTLWALIYLK